MTDRHTTAHFLSTTRLDIHRLDVAAVEAALVGDIELARHLSCNVPAEWTVFGREPFLWTLRQLQKSSPAESGWFTHLPVLRENGFLVGSGGFRGAPIDGVVEIGYEISHPFRGRGLAKEFAASLVDIAFSAVEVQTVCAHTLPTENVSTAVLRSLGFTMTHEVHDNDEGSVWRWELSR